MFSTWCLVIGVLLIAMGLTDRLRRELPVSAATLYMGAGFLLGPQVSGMIDLGLPKHAPLIEILTEIAVLISLFAVGMRLRVRLGDRLWRTPVRLATSAMLLTILMLAGIALLAGFTLGAALLLAAVLAPTDPVLASSVRVDDIADRDRLRFSLSGEGGLNDGTAFPFVMLALGALGLHELGASGWRWVAVDLLWATGAGLGLGWVLGTGFSRIAIKLRRERKEALGMESFLTLGLIALTYGIALHIAAYGFLAVFAAGLAMRYAEHGETRDLGDDHDRVAAEPDSSAYMAREVLDFTLDLERLAELAVMLLIGSLLSAELFTPTSIGIAVALLFVVRPAAVLLSTWGAPLQRRQRLLAAWFGIRGIGSLYYLSYAVAHGAVGDAVVPVVDAVLVTIAVSVLLHGSSAAPIMRIYRRARGKEA